MTVPVLAFQNVTAGYGKRDVVTAIDFTVARGEWLALLGPNGSGKTTLLHCAAGMHAPSAGDVLVRGHSKLAVLLALLGEPDVIIRDEAFNGLDPASSLVLKKHLRERVSAGRCGVLLATHAMDIVERYCDRSVLLLDGRLTAPVT